MTDISHLTFLDKKGRPHHFLRPTSPVADTHTHLVSKDADIATALAKAASAGVELVVNPLDPCSEARDVDVTLALLQAALDKVDAALTLRILAGSHPYHASEFNSSDKHAFYALLESSLCAGIGEIGLDYTCDVPKEAQIEAFRFQLEVACQKNCPVELHIRDAKGDEEVHAHKEAERVLREVGMPKAGVVLHCFTQGPNVMKPYVALGCTIAFGGALTFKKSEEIRAAALACPLDKMVVETDAPYMTPEPLRGLPCTSAYVTIVENYLASLLEDAGRFSKEAVEAALWQNATALFMQ